MGADLLFAFRDVVRTCSQKGQTPPFLDLGTASNVLQTELTLARAVVQYQGSAYVLASQVGNIAGNFGTPLRTTFGKVYPYREFVVEALRQRLCPDDLPPPPPIPLGRPLQGVHHEASAPAMRQISDWVVQHARTLQAGSLVLAGGAAIAGLIVGGISIPAILVGAGITAVGLAS